MRCAAVVEAVRRRGAEAEMVIPEGASIPGLEGVAEIRRVPDEAEVLGLAAAEGKPDVVVLDSYRHVTEVFEKVRRSGKVRVALFDDHYHPSVRADVLINGAPDAGEDRYAASAAGRLLLGSEYAAISGVFREARKRFAVRPDVRRVMVSLGGSEVGDRIGKLAAALDRVLPAGTEIVVTASPAAGSVSARVRFCGWKDPATAAQVMAESDMAFLAGGTMLTQAACLGLPAAAWPLNENQRRHAAVWAKQGTIVVFEALKEIPGLLDRCLGRKARLEMHARGRKLVDGQGAERIADAILSPD